MRETRETPGYIVRSGNSAIPEVVDLTVALKYASDLLDDGCDEVTIRKSGRAPERAEPGEPSEWHQVSPENYWREVWHHSHECRSGPMKRLGERLKIEDGSELRLFECASCGTRLFAGLDAKRMVVWRAEPGGGK